MDDIVALDHGFVFLSVYHFLAVRLLGHPDPIPKRQSFSKLGELRIEEPYPANVVKRSSMPY